MILLGKNITQINDLLTEVSVENVFRALKNANGEVAKMQERLKIIRSIDLNQYRRLKTTLPFIVCGQFNPRIRKKENFLFTQRFIIDIDHLTEHDIEIENIKNKFREDDRVELMFLSPGGDGLKLMFKTTSKISDSGYYSVFYKSFCIKLAEAYQLGSSVDIKTSDVSRCCFVSYDPNAYYNSNPTLIDVNDFIDASSFDGYDKLKKEEKIFNEEKTIMENSYKSIDSKQEIDPEILNAIKEKMGLKIPKRSEKHYEQPEELKLYMEKMNEIIESIGLTIKSNKPISYGRQIAVNTANSWAEFNLFFGKKGVSIVATTKTGSNATLCKLVVELLKNQLADL
jgi:hypothetical protein